MDRQKTVSGPDLLKQLTVLDAIYWIHNSWIEVEQSTIIKCFLKAGFVYEPYINSVSSDNIEENKLAEENKSDDEDDDVPLAVLKLSLDYLIQVDESVRTCDTDLVDWDNTPVADLTRQVSNDPVCGNDSETEEDQSSTQDYSVITLNQATEYVYQLKRIALSHGNCATLNLVSKLDEILSAPATNSCKQSKVTDFFTCARSRRTFLNMYASVSINERHFKKY